MLFFSSTNEPFDFLADLYLPYQFVKLNIFSNLETSDILALLNELESWGLGLTCKQVQASLKALGLPRMAHFRSAGGVEVW